MMPPSEDKTFKIDDVVPTEKSANCRWGDVATL